MPMGQEQGYSLAVPSTRRGVGAGKGAGYAGEASRVNSEDAARAYKAVGR